MNKKKDIIALALSVSFVMGGASIAQADEINPDNPSYISENQSSESEPSVQNLGNDDKNITEVNNDSDTKDNEDLLLSDEKTPEAQGAGEAGSQAEEDKNIQKADDPNYGEDEKKIKDYNGSNRYKETDLQPGDPNQSLVNTDEKKAKDGLKFELKNPADESSSKTEYGYQITIDKKTGQRTYTKIYVTDSGLISVDKGNKPMMNKGEKITPDSPDVTYKPEEDTNISASRRQRNLNYEASEDTLKHINNQDNLSTSFGMKDNYTKDNPDPKFFGDNFLLGYKVNPWPNENDKLEELKLNKNYYDPKKKYFVQGQDIDTGIKVDNVDENAKERLVGQVYNPITGKIVPKASAYIAEDGNIHIKLPDGALKKDKDGKTVINEDSIFNTPDYKALQNLDVKFFARPRTKGEFENIANSDDDGKYVETGAGSATIKHKGQDVIIDKQGIDRYDHYNLIGDFKLNLDDTRYYDQRFVDGNKDDTSKVTSSAVKPGEPFEVGIQQPENPSDTDKSAADMNGAQDRGEASGKLIMDFIDRENKGKADVDKWKVKVDEKDISKFTITPPKSAKAGDFVAIPLEYTYTNGSKDVHWFHFVVQESTYIRPEYDAQVNYPVNEQTSDATVAQDDKRIKPDHYTLPENLETDEAGNKLIKDDKGNDWTVTLDEKTGKVSAKPVDPQAFDGGEKLTVPVVAHYVDEQKPGEDIKEEVNAYFVIEEKANMTPRYNAKAGKEGDKLSSDVILNTEDKYNRRPGKYTLDSPTYTDDKGNVWNVSIDEKTGQVTATVPNAEEGKKIDGALLNVPVTAHYYEEDSEGNQVDAGTKKTEVQFVAYGTNGKVEKTEDIPFETIVEKDPKLKKGEIKVITEGEKGSKKVTYTIEDSKVTKTDEEVIKEATNRVIHVGEGVNNGTHKIEEKVEVPFETEIQFDNTLKPGEQKVEQEGVPGEKKRDVTLTIEDGNVTKTETGEFTETKAPQKKIIKVGANTEGKVEHKEELPFKYKVEEVEDLKKGEYRIVKPGKVGTKTTTWIIKNSKVEGEPTVTEVPAEDALIQVGKGTNEGTHEVTEKKNIDYKTIIEYDENLDAGQQEVVKEGNPGEQERTNTLVIKDGQVTETKEGEFKTTKEATDRVVKVGTKPVTKVVEKPFNTEYIYDENLESGKTEEVTPGKNGKVTITTTYNKETGKVETSETEEKGQNRVIKIGKKPTEGETTKTIEREIPYETKVIYDENLESGFQKIEKEGKAGKEEVTITQKIKDSKPVGEATETTKTITEKEDRVVRIGVKPVVNETELGNNTEYRHNPELKAGEEKVIEEGSKGSVKYTTTFNKETGKLEVKEERREPKNRVVEYGSKTDGEFTYESEKAYDIIIRENPNLETGKTKVIQEGKPGKTETTVKIENSKEVSRDTKTITEKQDKIIEIGTKNICEIPPVKPDPEKPGEEDPKDPSNPGEEDPKDPSNPGEEDPKDPEKPGEEDPEDPNKPGEEDPKDPENPGKEDPKDPSNPGEEKPNEPGTPGETPEKPGEPGKPNKPGNPGEENPKDSSNPGEEKPNEPGTPGETPEKPGKPGKPNKPGKPGEEDPKDPTNPGEEKPNEPGTPGETPEKPNKPGQRPENTKKPEDKNVNESKDKQINPSRKLEKTKTVINKDNTNKNPSTGVASLSTVLSSLGISLSALGFSKKKKKK
ncbi:G5 domain-containing protein [Anaerococcus hydrogenalis]|uniref:G5 domain-containing protein n=1 Tax=Anaerococcus hydrogenalis TaxID=33029 RepID=UPI0023F4DA89|nr:G5 domain-containing protein [Anaerococcus hydrogenalis]